MGIRGLMSYVLRQSDIFLQDFELQDTFLIIDGNCTMCDLYSGCNNCFGGDYKKFADRVSNFFNNLLTCRVTPFVIFDGAVVDKKLNTIYERLKEKIVAVEKILSPSCKNNLRILPLLNKEVFKHILEQKNIKCAQTVFEADDHIASLARILNCPVLSSDSDFFMHDIQYIPYDSLKRARPCKNSKNDYALHCKIFERHSFSKSFPNLNKKVLPVAAALLGNDYIKSKVFEKFISTLRVSRAFNENFKSISHKKIEKVFKWLEKKTLDEVISILLSISDPQRHEAIIKILETIINGYLNISSEMLGPLGFSDKDIHILMEKIPCELYKFQKVDYYFTAGRQNDSNEIYLSWDDDTDDSLLLDDYIINKPIEDIDAFIKTVPSWFLDDFKTAGLSGYFMDMLYRQLIITSVHVEDISHPTCVIISLKIIKMIYKILSNGTTNSKILKCIARGKGNDIQIHELNCDEKLTFEIPTLAKLKNFPIKKKRSIFDYTLGVSSNINEFPIEWRLYIAVIQYWCDETDQIFVTTYHLYSLVLLIVYYVIRRVIKYKKYFRKGTVNESKKIKRISVNLPVMIALKNVSKKDCILAEKFFKSQDYEDKENFDVTIVHVFGLFQNCLKSSIYFNALLGYPYQKINIVEFFDGTLAYNLCNYLIKFECVNKRIEDIFNKSPSVLQLFVSISTTIYNMCRKR